ncbi:MAG: FtsX-like permease family protein, partial [Candidatus Binatia bacterium]
TTLILLERMYGVARLIGIATLLIALPLLGIAWLLASNLSGLLILNERRKLGLLRLRGVPGRLMGQSLLLTIAFGGLLGGILGIALGTAIPLLVYEEKWLPWAVITRVQNPLFLFIFLVAGLLLALLVSRRLVRYAATISPLEASRRVAVSEAAEAGVSFSYLQFVCLVLGAYKILGWVFGFSLGNTILISEESGGLWRFIVTAILMSDRALDFVGLPFFVYGIVTLLVSRRRWVEGLLSGITGLTGGRLKSLSLRHMSLKPHRISGFLLIVALMTSVSLYPSIAGDSFEERSVRGATVQVGSELHLTLSPLDLVDAELLEGSLDRQIKALQEVLKRRLGGLSQQEGIQSSDYIIEALLPGFFYPGYGLSGVPLYLIEKPDRYLKTVHYEEPLGISGRFEDIIRGLKGKSVAVSPPVADFWRLSTGDPVLLGADVKRKAVLAPAGGIIGFLPGMPPRSITDRQSYVTARIDYLNYLTSNDAYLVATWDNPMITDLKVLIPRVMLLVRLNEGAEPSTVLKGVLGKLGVRPLEVRELREELQKVGGDMFIFMALENMRIYLVGGLLLSLIATLAIALTNYLEDKRTLALLRIRGASPVLIFRFFSSSLISPALIGLVIGIMVAGVAGYGLTNVIWDLREIRSVVHLLSTHLVVSGLTVWIILGLLAAIIGITVFFSVWVFRRTARETLVEV